MAPLVLLVNDRYRLVDLIGEGTYGQVWKAIDCRTNTHVAIKLEPADVVDGTLESEYNTYQALQALPVVPRVFWFGDECDYRAMALELLGPSLEDLFQYCHGKFSLKTVLMLAFQMIARLEDLYKRGVLHRDISTRNVMMGEGARWNRVYFTDLGLSTSEYSIQPRRAKHLVGTPPFASIAAHSGSEQTPCDDLESLGYMFVRFLKGRLPWETVKGSDRTRRVLEMKQNITTEKLCEGLPQEFLEYYRYIRSVKPIGYKRMYRRLRTMFGRLYNARGYKHDSIFDFTLSLYRMKMKHGRLRSPAT